MVDDVSGKNAPPVGIPDRSGIMDPPTPRRTSLMIS